MRGRDAVALRRQLAAEAAREAATASGILGDEPVAAPRAVAARVPPRAVDLDTELMSLIQLQNSYSANARVLSVAQELMDVLMATFK